ncbi:MAG: hypothetical protein K2X81_16215, partial [Candidatus Obscuribacterales bacterium]|nr:hypothetical protein [Candidatus Obscuribacterales bacterium]
ASNSVVNNAAGTSGVVFSNVNNLNVNASSSGANQSTLNLTGGAIVFDSKGANTVSLDGATFTVTAFRPISYTCVLKPAIAAATSFDSDESSTAKVLAHMFVPGCDGAQILAAKSTEGIKHAGSKNFAELSFSRGEAFISPQIDTTIHTKYADVDARGGSLLAINLESNGLRVSNCGASNDVSIKIANKKINLSAGEEILISAEEIKHTHVSKADGVGRRGIKHYQFAEKLYVSTCEFSIFTMLSSTQHLQSLRHPNSAIERKIANRMLKMSSALETVTRYRGAFQAQPAVRKENNKLGPLASAS